MLGEAKAAAEGAQDLGSGTEPFSSVQAALFEAQLQSLEQQLQNLPWGVTEQGGEQGGRKFSPYLARARCWRRSPMVSENSILTMYVCSPLSDFMRRVQTSGAGDPASSVVFNLEVRKPLQLRSQGSASSTDHELLTGRAPGVPG